MDEINSFIVDVISLFFTGEMWLIAIGFIVVFFIVFWIFLPIFVFDIRAFVKKIYKTSRERDRELVHEIRMIRRELTRVLDNRDRDES